MTGSAAGWPHVVPSPPDVLAARRNLTRFVTQQAEEAQDVLGFGYLPCADAPSTFESLRRAFARSVRTGEPLPVSDEHSDSVIFTEPAANFSLRYWHDVNHVRRRLTFNLVDELELSLFHLSALVKVGFPECSLEWQLLHADLIGQVYLMSLTRRFPLDQQRFGMACLSEGFDQALLNDARRLP